MRLRLLSRCLLFAAVVCLFAIGPAQAALVTTHETGLNTIFSQASFELQPIEIRFQPIVTVWNTELLDIDSEADFDTLVALSPDFNTQVHAFYVDDISWCGAVLPGIVGCGAVGGGVLAVDSGFASGGSGAELLAHELGHNLGLGHTGGAGLMGPTLNGDTFLSAGEVTTIRASSLVQTDGSGFFITVTPTLVRASAVPEPSSMLALTGLFAVGGVRQWRRKKQGTPELPAA